MQVPSFHSRNMAYAFQLHYHFGFRTLRGLRLLESDARKETLKNALSEVCERKNYHVLEYECDARWVRALLSLRPSHVPAKVIGTIKTNLSRQLLKNHPRVANETGRRKAWADSYYLRSVGDVDAMTVLEYVNSQRKHHELDVGNASFLAQYRAPNASQLMRMRRYSHCIAEYNCHLVCTPHWHMDCLSEAMAGPLVEYVRAVAKARDFDIVSVAVLSDHLHLLAALRPSQSPELLALTIMNNTHFWIRKNHPGVFKVWDIPGFWRCSAYVGTAGQATTNQVRAFLKRSQGSPVET